jgi:hypothetical protein
MSDYDFYALARRAKMERAIYIGELIGDAYLAIGRFFSRLFGRMFGRS